MNTPHEVVNLDGKTFFIAQFPEGDFVIHRWDPNCQDGYCGATITFLLQDGSMRTVKGPFIMALSWRDFKHLVKHLSRPELNLMLTKITVGKLEGARYDRKIKQIVHEEPDWSSEPIVSRIRKEWHDLDIRIETRNDGTRFTSVAYVLKHGADDEL